MATEVRCLVSDCEYWDYHNFCASSAILITHGSPHEKASAQQADRLGGNAYQLNGTPIQRIEESFCRTFIKKGPITETARD